MLGDSKLFVKLYVRVKISVKGVVRCLSRVFNESDLKLCVKSTTICIPYDVKHISIFIRSRVHLLNQLFHVKRHALATLNDKNAIVSCMHQLLVQC